MKTEKRYAIKFDRGHVPYHVGVNFFGVVMGTETVANAKQFATREEAEKRIEELSKLPGDRGAASIVDVPYHSIVY
jgi:hypothetical protein